MIEDDCDQKNEMIEERDQKKEIEGDQKNGMIEEGDRRDQKKKEEV